MSNAEEQARHNLTQRAALNEARALREINEVLIPSQRPGVIVSGYPSVGAAEVAQHQARQVYPPSPSASVQHVMSIGTLSGQNNHEGKSAMTAKQKVDTRRKEVKRLIDNDEVQPERGCWRRRLTSRLSRRQRERREQR